MNIDEIMRDMEAFDAEGAKYMTPVQYSKVRPVQAPQVYGWMRTGKLDWKRCDCGRRVINVEEADELMRSKGRLAPLKVKDNDELDEPDNDEPDKPDSDG